MIDNKYVYRRSITAYATRTQFSRVNGVLYLVAIMESNGLSWVVMHHSVDDGETWVEETVPVDGSSLLDPKLVVVGDDWYVFAHGDVDGVDVAKYCCRRVTGATATWDKSWTTLFPNRTVASRVTSAVLDTSGVFIHIAYDKLLTTDRYEVRYANFAVAGDTIANDVAVNSTPASNQHNGNLAVINANTVALVYEQENINRVSSIAYAQLNFINDEWSPITTLSKDEHHDNFHPSLTVDALGVVHVSWLLTADAFKTSSVVYAKVVDLAVTTPTVISTEAAKNNYPRVVVNEDDVYVVFNTASTVGYLVRHSGDATWTAVTNLTDDAWVVLDAVCEDRNIFTVCVDLQRIVRLVRVDVDLAETFAPINDLRITGVTSAVMNLAWTKARNAVSVNVEKLNPWAWTPATLLSTIGASDASARPVNLAVGVYRFRVVTTLADGATKVVNVGESFVNTVPKGDLTVTWTPTSGAVAQALEFTLETWTSVLEVPPTHDSCSVVLNGELTRYRLVVVGGVAAGLSNIVRPLTINLNADGDVALDWLGLSDVTSVKVQQSIDGEHWHSVVTTEAIAPTDATCVIPLVDNVVYRYRVAYVTSSGATLYTNTVSQVNAFSAVEVNFADVTVNWVDVVNGERRHVQYSSSDGAGWVNATNAVDGQSMTVTGLDYATTYLMRLYFPNRVTGVYSNVISVTTKPKPINDLKLTSSGSSTAELTFTCGDPFTSAHVHVADVVAGTSVDVDLSTVDTVTVVDGVNVHKLSLNSLKLGSYLSVTVVVDDGRRAGSSNAVALTTTGLGPANVKVVPGDHSLTVSADTLERITVDNVHEYVSILITDDGVNWTTVPVTKLDGDFSFTVNDLCQGVEYAVKLVVTYGDAYGSSDVIQATVNQGVYPAIAGQRLVGERTAAVRDDGSTLVYDRGVLYSIAVDGKSTVVNDFKLATQYSFAKLLVDHAGAAHLVFTHGKRVLYCTDAVVNGVKLSLNASRELAADVTVNAYVNVDATLGYDNVVTVVWEEDRGFFSNITVTQLLNGVTVAEPSLLINDGERNHVPRVVAKLGGGYHVACLGVASLKTVNVSPVFDPTSVDLLKETVVSEVFAVDNLSSVDVNWLAVAVDNLDGLRLAFNTMVNDLPATTYATVTGGKLVVDRVMSMLSDATVAIGDNPVVVGRNGTSPLATRYVIADDAWTDVSVVSELGVIDDNPPTVCFVNDEFAVVSVRAGELVLSRVPRSTIVAKHNVVDGRWIAGKLTLTTVNAQIDAWTCGDVDAHPLLFVKVNELYRDVTPRDGFGAAKHARLTTRSLVQVASTDPAVTDLVAAGSTSIARLTVTADGVDVDLLIDCTSMLAYAWCPTTIVNVKSNN